MLILTRRPGEVLRIGDDIQVIILDAKSRHVKIGIDAPREIKVLREELYSVPVSVSKQI